MRRLRRAEIAGQRVLLAKPRIDDRYDAADAVSHAGCGCRPSQSTGAPRKPWRGRVAARSSGSTRVTVLRADDRRRRPHARERQHVIAAGLDQDFRRLPFGPLPVFLARAEFVDKLHAVCHRCGGPATTTQRLVDGRPAPLSGKTIVVGALDSYEARCRDCHEAGADARYTPAGRLTGARCPTDRTPALSQCWRRGSVCPD